MELTNEILVKFIGGDIQIFDSLRDRCICGPVTSVRLDGSTLSATFEWLAQSDGSAREPSSKWRVVQQPGQQILRAMTVANATIKDVGNGHVSVKSWPRRIILILCPNEPRYKLNPSKVRGLELN